MPRRKRFARPFITALLLTFLLIVVVLPLLGLWAMSSSEPLVTEVAEVDAGSVKKARDLAKQLRKDMFSGKEEAHFSVTAQEINQIIALGSRGVPRLKGRVNLSPLGVQGGVTLHLPENPFGDYINLRFSLPPESQGLQVNDFSVGHISLPGSWALALAEWLGNFLLGERTATEVLKMVNTIRVEGDQLLVNYRPMTDIQKRLDIVKDRVKSLRDDLALAGDPAVVRLYYAELCRVGQELLPSSNVSLRYHLAGAFHLAEKRTFLGYSPVEENRAALLAAAIYLGSPTFQAFTGTVRTGELVNCRAPKDVVLAERRDLRLHFIYSVGIKVLADSGVSFAMGEFKELLDASGGGSGFSFIDLAADRAGIRFAELALDREGAAYLQQQMAAVAEESFFFPALDDLPEGLTDQEFETVYGGVNGEGYLAMVEEIDRRIAGRPLFAGR